METEIREMLRAKADEALQPALPTAPLLRRVRRRRAGNGLVAAAIMSGLVIGAVLVAGRVREVEPVAPSPKPRVGAAFSLPASPKDLAFGFGSVWVSTDDALLRLDPVTGEVLKRFDEFPAKMMPKDVGVAVNRIVVGEDAVFLLVLDDGYVSTFTSTPPSQTTEGNTTKSSVGGTVSVTPPPPGFRQHWALVRIDPRTNAVTSSATIYDSLPNAVAFGDHSAWATAVSHTEQGAIGLVSRFDERSGRLIQTFEVAGEPTAIAVEPGSVWLALFGDGQRVIRLDPRYGTEVDGAAVSLPGDIVVTGDLVWITSNDTESWAVDRFSKASLGSGGSIPVGRLPFSGFEMIRAGSHLWLVSSLETDKEFGGKLRWIDPIAGSIVGTMTFTNYPSEVAAGDGVLWVAGGGSDYKLWRVDLPEGIR